MLEAAYELTQRIQADFEYVPGATSIATPLGDVMRTRRGVCQDFAHLEISMLRGLGLSARYVSGYLRTRPAPGEAGARRRGRDARLAVRLLSRVSATSISIPRMARFRSTNTSPSPGDVTSTT